MTAYPVELIPVATHDPKDRLDAQPLCFLGHAAQEAELPVEHLADGAAHQALEVCILIIINPLYSRLLLTLKYKLIARM